MLNLAEYRRKPDRLSDYLPWAALVAPGILLNKDGSFLRAFRFRGPDLDSAIAAELAAGAARINNALRRLGSGWAIFIEARRARSAAYPDSEFPDPVSALVDAERHFAFAGVGEGAGGGEGEGRFFESRSYLTLLYMPPADGLDQARRLLIEAPESRKSRPWRAELANFVAETDRIADLLAPLMAEFAALDDRGLLTYLHDAISDRPHALTAPETPIHLDAILADTPVTGGLAPMLGNRHLRMLTILGFPPASRPGLLDALNRLGFGYRWMTRFIALDRPEAAKLIARARRQWFAKRKSLLLLLREVLYNEAPQLLDSDAAGKVLDADAALQVAGEGDLAFGYLTTTLVVADDDPGRAEEKRRALEQIVHALGFTTIRESVNALEAWLGSLPGHVYANVRQPVLHTRNLAHLVPFSSVWAGPEGDRHLAGPPLFQAETRGATPFRLSTHLGDVGHMLVVGPTGAGKSVLLAFMALQFRRYPQSQIFLFDKGLSARASVLAMGGIHHRLEPAGDLAFQPLAAIDDEAERAWAAEWIAGLLLQEGVAPSPEGKEMVWAALTALAQAPAGQRTLTGLALLLAANRLKAALAPFLLGGASGQLLDSAADELALGDLVCFETEALLRHRSAIAPVLAYLFHRLEQRFDGRPTLLILDEAWAYLDHPLFAQRLGDWLKTLRKKNVGIVFATQSLADIARSDAAPVIVESCPQRIFLPNARAIEPQIRALYEGFGLNARQIELLAEALPKRDYYLQSTEGNRLFSLRLGPLALSLCAASQPSDQALIDELLARHGREGFARAWLVARGLDWAASLIDDIPTRIQET